MKRPSDASVAFASEAVVRVDIPRTAGGRYLRRWTRAVTETLLTVDEVADRLRCSLTTVKRRIRSGALPAVRDGRLVRVREADFHRYLLERLTRQAGVPALAAAGTSSTPGARLWE